MNHLLLLLSAILVVGLFVPAYAQTISESVVINELDTNPPGDDSESISEWVELFNPTDSEIDLSGWEIASTTILKKTLTIPDGTVIASNDIIAFTYEQNWFTDSNESVELRNSNGVVIDKTPTFTDYQNNFLSWQRIIDGSSDWKFLLASAGASNGKSTNDVVTSKLIIDVSTDKTSYLFDETAIIQGTVSKKVLIEKPSFQVAPIIIDISGPNFYQSVSMYPDNYLNYETTLDLVQVLGITKGTYDVSVSYAGVSSSTSFNVDFEIIEKSEELESSFNISTDKSTYIPGEFISVSGFTSKIIPFESVKYKIIQTGGDILLSGNMIATDGNFSTDIFLPLTNLPFGVYTVSAEYSNETTFTTVSIVEKIIDNPIILISDSILIELDNSEYTLDDKVIISGLITNFDSTRQNYTELVEFTFKKSDGSVPHFSANADERSASISSPDIDFILTAIPKDSGEFSIDLRLAPILFSHGDYTINANFRGLTDSVNFSIPDDTSTIMFKEKTILEKVNRISDSLIPILTNEKTIDDQSVKPRVLSGSMITVSKNNQSDVNLQVMSQSGICIIGQNSDCLVSESTRKPGQIFEVVNVDGLNLNVRYSGPDVRLEKFSILPESSEVFLPNTNWNVEVIKGDEVSRFYYKITYKTIQ